MLELGQLAQRRGQRELLNGDALKDATALAATAAGLRFRAVALEDIGFSEQLELFGDCALLVAQYGSALHNVLFLPDAAVVLMLPMPKWCDESWHFERQAYLLGHAVVRVCAAGDDAGRRVRWARRSHAASPLTSVTAAPIAWEPSPPDSTLMGTHCSRTSRRRPERASTIAACCTSRPRA